MKNEITTGKCLCESIKFKIHGNPLWVSHGTYTFSDGRQNTGEYKNDKEWNAKAYNSYGRYTGSWVNGVWRNQ